MTTKLYLENTYLFDFQALIQESGKDEKGAFFILDVSAFYPQGGGQPSDRGVIVCGDFQTSVLGVAHVNDEIRHYVSCAPEDIPLGSKVSCLVSQERRMINARYHSAAHLLSNVVEKLCRRLQAVKGHSFPGEAYVVFQTKDSEKTAHDMQAPSPLTLDVAILEDALGQAIEEDHKTSAFYTEPRAFEAQFYKLPYEIGENKHFRAIRIGDMPPVPCGGTHVANLKEIGSVHITKIKAKGSEVCIHFSLNQA